MKISTLTKEKIIKYLAEADPYVLYLLDWKGEEFWEEISDSEDEFYDQYNSELKKYIEAYLNQIKPNDVYISMVSCDQDPVIEKLPQAYTKIITVGDSDTKWTYTILYN